MTSIWQRIRGGGQPELTCVELVELVTDYLEGALSSVRARAGRGAPRRLRELHALPRGDARRRSRSSAGSTGTTSPPEAKSELLEAFRGWAAS